MGSKGFLIGCSYRLLLLTQASHLFTSASPAVFRTPTISLVSGRSCRALPSLDRFLSVIGLAYLPWGPVRKRQFSASAKMPGVTEEKFSRLPTNAVPTHYTITLTPNLTDFVFAGKESIDLQLKEASSKLKLYASGLTIDSAKIQTDAEELEAETTYDSKWETVEITSPKELAGGSSVKLSLDFSAKLTQNMKGFYYSTYKNESGKEQIMASTQFESTFARRAFPCWDEPVYKATFDITLVVAKDYVALSNMNAVKEEDVGDGQKAVTFATTPKMSTYLVAFAIGNFTHIETKTNSGTIMRVYTVPGKEQQGKFALECGKNAIDFYDEFFGLKYPLPKCDLIAIPNFAMGAMENWGLVTYREVLLLVDESRTSNRQKSRVALVVGHELAHMWFGNLATMVWWTDLWLKEGFATFMEYMFVGDAYPEFQIWLQFVNDEISRGMDLDGLKSSHPIEVPINNPNEIEDIYDAVSYAKSASVIRMLYHYLGPKVFESGSAHYLKTFQYSNAETKDLWKALSDASDVDVVSLMSEWTGHMGYPVITVSSRQDGKNRILSLKQKRFLSDGSEDESAPVWKIPISVLRGSKPNEVKDKLLLDEKEMEVVLENVGESEFVKLNAGLTGFFRVEYSENMLDALIEAVRKKMLKPVDRFNLVSDLFALVQAGKLPATQFLDLLSVCKDEEDYIVWREVDSGVGVLRNCFARTPEIKKKLDSLIRDVYTPIADKLGWEKIDGEDFQTGSLRSLVLGRLGKAEHAKTVEIAKEKFRAFVEEDKEILPDLRRAVFTLNGVFDGDEAAEKLEKIYEATDFPEVKIDCLLAMGVSPIERIQKKTLEFGMGNKVRSQDKYICFMGCSFTPSGQDTMWNYYKENMETLIELYNGANDNIFQHITKIAIQSHSSEERAKEIEEFFTKSEYWPALERIVKQSVENVRLNAQLLEQNKDAVKEWFAENGY